MSVFNYKDLKWISGALSSKYLLFWNCQLAGNIWENRSQYIHKLSCTCSNLIIMFKMYITIIILRYVTFQTDLWCDDCPKFKSHHILQPFRVSLLASWLKLFISPLGYIIKRQFFVDMGYLAKTLCDQLIYFKYNWILHQSYEYSTRLRCTS